MDEGNRRKTESKQAHVFPPGETPCVWMTAGILTCWLCDRDLNCEACPLDAALRHVGERLLRPGPHPEPVPLSGPPPSPAESAPDVAEPWSTPLSRLDAHALYAEAHTWVRPDADGVVRIGLDPFAAHIVGRLRCVVLAPVGTFLHRGKPCAWLDQHGGTLTLLAPVSGQVVQCNESLAGRSEVALHDPLHSDWLLQLQPSRWRSESRQLLDAERFAPILRRDLEDWRESVRAAVEFRGHDVGRTMADGGAAVTDLGELLGGPALHRLAARFLGAKHGRRTKDSRSL